MSMKDGEEQHATEVARDDPNHDVGDAVEVTINDPEKYAGLLPPFHLGWWREVVYGSAKTRPQIYYYDPERKKFRSRKAIAQHFQDNPQNHLSEWSFDWWREPLGLNNQHYEVVREAKQQKTRLPGVFHSRPGDIGEESWGILESAEDYNANSMDFNKEQATYAKAKKVKEGQHVVGHTIWQTRGATSSWSTSDDEPVAVTVKGSKTFLTSLGELSDAGPDPIEIDVGPAVPRGESDYTGPLTVREVYGVRDEEEDSESDAIPLFTI